MDLNNNIIHVWTQLDPYLLYPFITATLVPSDEGPEVIPVKQRDPHSAVVTTHDPQLGVSP